MESSCWISQFFDWQLPSTTVPLANTLLGDLLVVSSAVDVAIDDVEPEKGFQFIHHPNSLRANLLVIVDRGHQAFESARSLMSAVRQTALLVVDQFSIILEALRDPDVDSIDQLIELPILIIEQSAEGLDQLADEIVQGFVEPMGLVRELLAACQKANRAEGDAVEMSEDELKIMDEKYGHYLDLMERWNRKEMGRGDAVQDLLDYSCWVLGRLLFHWDKTQSSFRSMADVIHGISSSSLTGYAKDVRQMCHHLPLSPMEMKALLSASVKVHQICDVTESMADLYVKMAKKYVVSSFDGLALRVTVAPKFGQRPTVDRAVAVGQREELLRQIEQRLEAIENQYVSLHNEHEPSSQH